MRQQNDMLSKKCKEESDKKLKFEKDFEKEQQRLKELERISEQQQKLLKKKTEDLLTAQRRLRSGSMNNLTSPIDGENNSKHWTSEKQLELEKKQLEILKEELIKKQELVEKKENLLKETEKKIIHMGTNYNQLEETYNSLLKQRKLVEARSNTPTEMRRLVEIDEALEALKAAIDYENDSRNSQKLSIKGDKNLIENSTQVSILKYND
jgi:hypothetical protein